jgi:5-methylcytosine-specific restriction endonuclease McrA
MRAWTICIVGGCPAFAVRDGRCAQHQLGRHGSTRAWRALRLRILERDGYRCQVPGCGRPATEVDHLVAVVNLGTDDERNRGRSAVRATARRVRVTPRAPPRSWIVAHRVTECPTCHV